MSIEIAERCRDLEQELREVARVWVARLLLVRFLNRFGERMSKTERNRLSHEISILTRAGMYLANKLLERVYAECPEKRVWVEELLNQMGAQAIPLRKAPRTLRAAERIARRVLGDADPLKILARLEVRSATL